ncbi:hypothetical protein CFC21_052172 [Triticum aestivum]|uniref:Uncharacterized protein n=3 Tax=Triticum TaxID=4564 RepID=A0A9R0VZ77_TRITD|nr:hypothetical protein CFC21_052172 [Triticum aestivum]VAH90788.1 unnamed protein product [Triticum turgidum subsp. durum]
MQRVGEERRQLGVLQARARRSSSGGHRRRSSGLRCRRREQDAGEARAGMGQRRKLRPGSSGSNIAGDRGTLGQLDLASGGAEGAGNDGDRSLARARDSGDEARRRPRAWTHEAGDGGARCW